MNMSGDKAIGGIVGAVVLITFATIGWPLISSSITSLTGNLSGVSGASLISASLLGLLFVVGLFYALYKMFGSMWK